MKPPYDYGGNQGREDLTPQDSMFVWAILIIFTLADIAVIAWMKS